MATPVRPNGYAFVLKNCFPIMLTIVFMSAVLLSTVSHGSCIEQETDDYHKIYARNAKPYANLVYDKSLPFVPRYRYPVRRYYGKRSGGLYYGSNYNPAMYDDDVEWSPFLDAYSQNMDRSKRPFTLPSRG